MQLTLVITNSDVTSILFPCYFNIPCTVKIVVWEAKLFNYYSFAYTVRFFCLQANCIVVPGYWEVWCSDILVIGILFYYPNIYQIVWVSFLDILILFLSKQHQNKWCCWIETACLSKWYCNNESLLQHCSMHIPFCSIFFNF